MEPDNSGTAAQEVRAFIDARTPCLIERATGSVLQTAWRQMRARELHELRSHGWSFDWMAPIREGQKVYGLTLAGRQEIQGLISMVPDQAHKSIHVGLVEAAPHNVGAKGAYKGVGAHLFAIAAKASLDAGYGGHVCFDAKTALIRHYEETLGARRIGGSQRMVIGPDAANSLVEQYIKGGDRSGR